jgi:hypothetical protein
MIAGREVDDMEGDDRGQIGRGPADAEDDGVLAVG